MNDVYVSLHQRHLDDRELRVLNAYKCLRILRGLVPFGSVVDFGCGIGGWLVAAKQLGVGRVLGIEGDWLRPTDALIGGAELQIADLSRDTIRLGRSFDLCLSIEVAEHLPAAAADGFCDSLVDAANLLIFSAAIPNQGGVGHVNEQPPRYWVDRFWERGFVPLEILRPAISDEPGMYSWLRQNLIVFINYGLLHIHPELARFALPKSQFYVKYVPM